MIKGEDRESQGSLGKPRRIQCVTFGCYGTLIDRDSGLTQAIGAIPGLNDDPDKVKTIVRRREEIEKALLVIALDLPEEDSPAELHETLPYRPYREILAESIQAACREAGIDVSPAGAATAAATMSDWEPFADTRAALEEIRERFKIGILSNVENDVIEETIRKIGVPFDLVVTAENVESYKPSPDHWFAAMHEMALEEDEILHLAASPFHDLQTATLLGIPCGYINRIGGPLVTEAKPLFMVPDIPLAAKRLKSFPASSAVGRETVEKHEKTHERMGKPKRPPQGGSKRSGPRR